MVRIQASELKEACRALDAAPIGEPDVGGDDRMLWAKLRLGGVHLDIYWDSHSNGISVDLLHEEPGWMVGLHELQMATGDQAGFAIGANDAASLREAMQTINAALSAPGVSLIVAGDRRAWSDLMATVGRLRDEYTSRFTADIPPDEARVILQRAIADRRLLEVRESDGALRYFRPSKLRLDHRGSEICIGVFVAGDGSPRTGVISVNGLKAIALSDDQSRR